MKAQSELTGDCKRRVETARPRRKAEQQIWMPIDDDMNNLLRETNELTQAYRSEIADLGLLGSEIGIATAVPPAVIFNPEVNHRPAAQQWAVCTP